MPSLSVLSMIYLLNRRKKDKMTIIEEGKNISVCQKMINFAP